MKIARIYSGEQSTGFWNLVNRLKSDRLKGQMFILGCRLQEVENTVLKALEDAIVCDETFASVKESVKKLTRDENQT